MGIRELLCWHKYVKSRLQLQALGTYPPTTTFLCKKCGKMKITDLEETP